MIDKKIYKIFKIGLLNGLINIHAHVFEVMKLGPGIYQQKEFDTFTNEIFEVLNFEFVSVYENFFIKTPINEYD